MSTTHPPPRRLAPPTSASAAGARGRKHYAVAWDPPHRSRAYETAKRSLDLLVSAAALLLLLPLWLLIATLIKLTDGGPVLFTQTRVGRGGRCFRFYKFRSMVANAEQQKAALLDQNELHGDLKFKMRSDPRVTWIGWLLRKSSLDEAPQLWNVLRGDMSLVGPRPPVPAEVDHYTDYQRRRLAIQPGITCIWQVSGRSLVPFEQQVEMDLQYIRQRSLWLDVSLLIRTVPAVVLMRGAY